MENLAGKVAFITGGVSGIGLGIAKAFAGAGMKIVLGYRRQDHLEQALEWFARHPGYPVHSVRLDVTDREDWARAADAAEAAFGKIHVLVNNAGVSLIGPMEQATYDDWDWIMAVNFGGVVNGLVTCLPRIMRHGEGGHIVNVSSMAAFLAPGDVGLYAASKFAVRGLTEALRPSLARHEIGVSLLAPGLTQSNIHHSAAGRPAEFANTAYTADPEFEQQFSAMMAIGMDPDEVGVKTLAGVRQNKGLIFSHPEFREELREMFDEILAAFPDEPVPPARLAIEDHRRAAKKAAGGALS